MKRDVYSGYLRLFGEDEKRTIIAANNYAWALMGLNRFNEAKSLLLKTTPVARRILGDRHYLTLMMRMNYAEALYKDASATLSGLREAVTTLEDAEWIARRVFGSAHPHTAGAGRDLERSRAVPQLVLRRRAIRRASETPVA